MSDTQGADDLGAADPITGVPEGGARIPEDPGLNEAEATERDYAADDPLALRAEAMQTVTNDAVAGETVLPGPGDGNDGPTGGNEHEIEPILPDNRLAGQDLHLDDQR